MGWIVILLLAGVSLAGLWLSGRCSRMALEVAGAILLVGIAGYAWQGSPDMPGNPVSGQGR